MDTNKFLLKNKKALESYINKNYIKDISFNEASIFKCFKSESIDLDLSEDKLESSDRSLDDVLNHIDDTFQEAMFYHIDSKHLDEVEVYTNAHIDRRLFSKIRSNKNYKPSKKTAICICFGLKLNIDETSDLLEKAGYALSHSSKADLIIEYFISIKEYNLTILNEVLYEYGEELLYV